MAKKAKSSTGPAAAGPNSEIPSEVQAVLDQAQTYLDAGQPKKALDLLVGSRMESPWIANALGVCQLRLNNPVVAVRVFKDLAMDSAGFKLSQDVPVVFKANFAAALFLDGNVSGCLSTLQEIRNESHPAVRSLRQAIQQWVAGLSFWQRLLWHLGAEPNQAVQANELLGALREDR